MNDVPAGPELAADGFAAAQPHGPIEELFDDVFIVHGSISLFSAGPDYSLNRNMVILRDGATGNGTGALTLIHSVRLDAAGEKALEALGDVKHVLRLGAMHGQDDAYYVNRYGAEFWCHANSPVYAEPATDHVLNAGCSLPVADATLFVFELPMAPETAMLLKRDGGLLITADSLQHHAAYTNCSPAMIERMKGAGFDLTTIVGPIWQQRLTPEGGTLKPDFDRLLALDFKHHISAHGALARGTAHALTEAAVAKAFQE
ncbi:MAG: hypothetical protein HOK61_06490 [Alphaproteobacteria bacterium]|jgi:hypothetical protein|nr:hypothetical protein [Alphaproteobacteria bacterium]